jgi:plasmid stabilization system protein ParE
MKKYSVLFYPKAQSDLEEIREYFEQVLSVSATDFLEQLLAHIEVVEDNPYIHAQVGDPLLKETVRLLAVTRLLVLGRTACERNGENRSAPSTSMMMHRSCDS